MSKKKHRHPPRWTPERVDRYMGMAWMWASMSHDPSTQVGAVIIGSDNRPLGSGYNGPPKQFPDNEIDWIRPYKYPYLDHAEDNAIDYCSEKPKGATIYVTARPCSRCMKRIVKSGIIKVIYFNNKPDKGSMTADDEDWEIAKHMAKMATVTLEEFQGNVNWIRDWTDDLYAKGVFG
jgi:dCMP deaminase